MPKRETALKVIPLGGLDGIGKNMTVFEYGRDLILDDAGLMFPDDTQPGIDLVLPDYSYLLEHEDRLRGIIITHGHEDHIGALPYVLRDLTKQVPIYSSRLTIGMIQNKLNEFNIKNVRFVEVDDGTNLKIGAFDITFFSMTHSIPAAFGVFMKTPAGTVMHSGDFKFDQTPIDAKRPNYQAINRFADEGIDLLLSDSTNANRPGFTPSEAAVGPSLRQVIKNAKGRVFVASFSSHIHRLQQVCDASVAVGRKVVVTGRSMVNNTAVARELGYLNVSDKNIIDAYEVDTLPNKKITVLCTGSQGEPLSALARMASGGHKSLAIEPDDTVIISATPVPGNEKSVQSLINALSKIGCEIYDKSRAVVHVSGHGSQEELKLMLGMAKPHYFMPVHGETQHLKAHAKLAEQMGIRSKDIFILDNGDTLEMRHHKVRVGNRVPSGVVYVDGGQVTDPDAVVLSDRQRLADDGVITCTALISRRKKSALACEVFARGVSYGNNNELFEELSRTLQLTLDKRLHEQKIGVDALRRAVRTYISSEIWTQTRTRPLVIPVVLEV